MYNRFRIFHNFIEFVFITDMVLNFFSAFVHKESYEVIIDYKSIAINYLNGWFAIDFVSIFPFQLILNDPSQA